ncbi:CGNR zinc finger domain-containing protein [Kutzneria viridogrisea]|uniref:Zinc finger CGNR domain-containing protein n=1 Tax=Kutzneria viridogrisea TaxID=47990 RepID=A0ABR6BKC7_9PSEU|nr:hypothetical protein [Kutzneria viridogrisea]
MNPRGLYFLVELANSPAASTDELKALLRKHGDTGPELTEFGADRLRQAASELVALLSLRDEDEIAAGINALLDRYGTRPHLVRMPGRPWSMHAKEPSTTDRAEWLLSTAALALGLWMSDRGYPAWGSCAAPDCGRFFVDTGRRARQVYCSTRCGTRVRVAAHREKRQDG